jgi:hypothetical protein
MTVKYISECTSHLSSVICLAFCSSFYSGSFTPSANLLLFLHLLHYCEYSDGLWRNKPQNVYFLPSLVCYFLSSETVPLLCM